MKTLLLKHGMKRAVSLLLIAAFIISIMSFAVVPASAVTEVKGKTLSQVLGMDGKTYFEWMNSHVSDNYYNGTPYAPYDHRNPNGDRYHKYGVNDSYGTPALNCTGFVWHALYMPTKLSGGKTKLIPAYCTASTWYGLYANNRVTRRYFTSKAAMLKSGYAEKGDVIWMYRYSEFTPADNNHIAIYWGDGHSDRVWHAVKKGTCFGYISPNYKLYVVLKSGAIPSYKAPKITSFENTVSGTKITWKKVNGAANYRVFYKEEGGKKWTGLGNTTSTHYTHKAPKSGVKYRYTVRCISADGSTYTSDYNKDGKAHTFYAAPKLKTESTRDGIKLSWSSSDGVTYYRVYRKAPGEESFSVMGYVKGTSYIDNDVESNKEYLYTVRCSNKQHKGVSAYRTPIVGRHLDEPVITSAYVNKNGLNLKWNAVDGAEMYRAFAKVDGKWTKLGDTKKLYFKLADPVAGNFTSYTVRCIQKDGKKYTSTYDPEGVRIGFIATPAITSLTSCETGVDIRWAETPEGALCRVYRMNDEGAWVAVADTAETGFIDTDVTLGNEYTYTIRYIDAETGEFISRFEDGTAITFTEPEPTEAIVETDPTEPTAAIDATDATVSTVSVEPTE